MRIRITPGGSIGGTIRVPGDKSISHRWLILASTALGRSALVDLPASLDVRSMASCLGTLSRKGRPALHTWASNDASVGDSHSSTWNVRVQHLEGTPLEVEGEGRSGLVQSDRDLDCGNSGTAMRLLAGLVAAAPFRSVLTGDESLRSRPMERIAEPLRAMGASIATREGGPPLDIVGGGLRGITYRTPVPSAQVKGAIVIAGLDAEGETVVDEALPTRDHTERAIRALGGPIRVEGSRIAVRRFQHEGFRATVPGDPSSAAFLIVAAALSGRELTIEGVGLNPSRLHYLEVLGRMGVRTERRIEREEIGEPVGDLWVSPCDAISPVRLDADEVPLVIDEIPLVALLASHAGGESRFIGAGELRFKESDRLNGVARAIVDLGGQATVEGDDLVLGGGGLRGGTTGALGDHRMAMSLTVAAIGSRGPVEVDGMEAADVSFPGFIDAMRGLGSSIEVVA
jgi:3-phosphoshikimate 1-carboxyvinyltransferase